MAEQVTYRFKHNSWSLSDYVANRIAESRNCRMKADQLLAEASTIEKEIDILRSVLVEVK